MEFKYIIIDRVKAVLFAHGIEHIDEANGRNVTSAGFVRITACISSSGHNNSELWENSAPVITVMCFGRSTSLNIDSNPDRDSKIIRKIAEQCMGMGVE